VAAANPESLLSPNIAPIITIEDTNALMVEVTASKPCPEVVQVVSNNHVLFIHPHTLKDNSAVDNILVASVRSNPPFRTPLPKYRDDH